MSNEIDTNVELEEATSDLRADDFNAAPAIPPAHKSFVKPVIAAAPGTENIPITAADLVKMAKDIEEKTRQSIAAAKFDSTMQGQIMPRKAAPITDFSKVTLDQVYDLDFPIEAKPFMSADGLTIKLKDTNYEARYVNKNPMRIGELLGKGFTYIEPNDLLDDDAKKAIEPALDAQSHYSINDVVAMKIDKATYYRALRAAHERAVSTTNAAKLHERAAKSASAYMDKSDFRNDFVGAKNEGKMGFYSPDVTI